MGFDISLAEALCPSHPPPNVAFCISGGARTLVKPQVHASLKRNLIEAFGGKAHVFWSLGLGDAPVRHQAYFNVRPLHVNASQLAAAREALTPVVENIYSGNNNESLYMEQWFNKYLKTPCFKKSIYFRSKEHVERNGALFQNMIDCDRMVVRYESEQAARFDWVVWTRPDVAIYASIYPHCLWEPRYAYMSRGPAYGRATLHSNWIMEHVMVLPRNVSSRVLNGFADILGKTTKADPACYQDGTTEKYMPVALRMLNISFLRFLASAFVVRENIHQQGQCSGYGAVVNVMERSNLKCWNVLY